MCSMCSALKETVHCVFGAPHLKISSVWNLWRFDAPRFCKSRWEIYHHPKGTVVQPLGQSALATVILADMSIHCSCLTRFSIHWRIVARLTPLDRLSVSKSPFLIAHSPIEIYNLKIWKFYNLYLIFNLNLNLNLNFNFTKLTPGDGVAPQQLNVWELLRARLQRARADSRRYPRSARATWRITSHTSHTSHGQATSVNILM